MTVLSYQSIKKSGLISPSFERQISNGLTHGIGPAGYDVRVAEDKLLWPGRFFLASTVEYFDLPHNVLAVVHDKSTWARRGLFVHNTVIEPGWRGHLTLEIEVKIAAGLFGRLRTGTPIAQIVFHQLDHPTERPYSGRYQDQPRGAVKAKLAGQRGFGSAVEVA